MMPATFHPEWLDEPEVRKLAAAFSMNSPAALRFVGGAVRDALLGLPVEDIDAATPLMPEAVMALLQDAGIKTIPTGIEHGTVTAVVEKKHFEITTLRRDVETFGRHAKVEYTDDWEADAARRDFTINALYLSPAGELFDYFNGREDLEAGRVHFIGAASDRIAEDCLRILRFFRFYARYAAGAPEQEALSACAAAANHIADLSGERIQTEMMKLLAAPHPSMALTWMRGAVAMHTFGFDIAVEAIERLERIEAKIGAKPEAMVRLATLLLAAPKMAEHLANAWKFSNAARQQLQLLLTHVAALRPDLLMAEQKKMLRMTGASLFRSLVMLRWVLAGDAEETHFRVMLQLADSWTPPPFPLSGDDLKLLGMKEGKSLGDVLRRLEETWEASDYTLTREQLLIKAGAA